MSKLSKGAAVEAVGSEIGNEDGFFSEFCPLGPDPALGSSYTSHATENAALSNTALVLKPIPKIVVWITG